VFNVLFALVLDDDLLFSFTFWAANIRELRRILEAADVPLLAPARLVKLFVVFWPNSGFHAIG